MVAAVATEIRRRGIGLVVIAARGTSDHAAVYAQYVLGARNGLTVALAAPSLVTLYGASPGTATLVVGISQSGRSPDVVGVVAAARAQGALTLAITNDPTSPLASTAAARHRPRGRPGAVGRGDQDLHGGADRRGDAVGCARRRGSRAALAAVPDARPGADRSPRRPRIAADQAALDRAVVLGRGFGYATAREWSLKLKEVAQLWADPYSAADFAHGPVALLAPGLGGLREHRAGTGARRAARPGPGADPGRRRGHDGAVGRSRSALRRPLGAAVVRAGRVAGPDRGDRPGAAARHAPGDRPRAWTRSDRAGCAR